MRRRQHGHRQHLRQAGRSPTRSTLPPRRSTTATTSGRQAASVELTGEVIKMEAQLRGPLQGRPRRGPDLAGQARRQPRASRSARRLGTAPLRQGASWTPLGWHQPERTRRRSTRSSATRVRGSRPRSRATPSAPRASRRDDLQAVQKAAQATRTSTSRSTSPTTADGSPSSPPHQVDREGANRGQTRCPARDLLLSTGRGPVDGESGQSGRRESGQPKVARLRSASASSCAWSLSARRTPGEVRAPAHRSPWPRSPG